MRNNTRTVTAAALIGAAYAVLTVALAPISYGAVQLRISEALCVLPYFIPSTAWGLFIGCLIANIMTGNIFDVVFGSLATLIAALLTAHFGKQPEKKGSAIFACLMPVAVNSVIIGLVITGAYNGMNALRSPLAFAVNALWIALGEAAVMLLPGLALLKFIQRNKAMNEYIDKAIPHNAARADAERK